MMTRGMLICMCLVTLFGCGGDSTPAPEALPVQPVSGVVKVDGKEMEGVTVTFFPVDGAPAGQRPASGTTDASGKYTLHSGEGEAGAAAGNYRVLFTRLLKPDGSLVNSTELAADVMATNALPEVYNSLADTPFGAEVPEGGKTFDFDLKAKK